MDPDDPLSASWNTLELKPPHIEFFESTKRNISHAKQAVINEYRSNDKRDLLFLEMLTLSRFMSSRKDKYRSDKGFKTIPKIIKAVTRIYQLDLKTLTTLMKANLSCDFAPSRQVCQWLLIKLLSNGLLLKRTIECSKYSVFMLNHRLRTGHSWVEITIAMAMISRIWSLATHLIKNCCYSYQKLIVIQKKLPSNPKDKTWKFMNYQFPINLEHWMEQPHFIPSYSRDLPILSEEIGVPKRSDDDSTPSKDVSHRARVLENIKSIKSAKSLKCFILKERKRRQLRKRSSLSRNIDAAQWQIIEKKLRSSYTKLRVADDRISLLKRIRKKIGLWLLI